MKTPSLIILFALIFLTALPVQAQKNGAGSPGNAGSRPLDQPAVAPQMLPSTATMKPVPAADLPRRMPTEPGTSAVTIEPAMGIPEPFIDGAQTATSAPSFLPQKARTVYTSQTGELARQLAQDQIANQTQMKEALSAQRNRNTLQKRLLGPDYRALKQLRQQQGETQARIQELQQLESQLTDPAEQALVSEMVESLATENAALANEIAAEEKSVSVLGWLLRIFAR